MLKFMKHQHKLTPERIQKQKELFAFNKACYHGFPAKPSALAWDPRLRLLAIATKTPSIRLYGRPGVEVYGQSDACESPITHLTFLSGQCRLVSLCEDNSLHLWEMREEKEVEESGGATRLRLVHVKATSLEGKLKKISVVACGAGAQHVMVGTEGGNIYLLQVASFTMSDNIIYQDVVMQNVPEDYKLNPGPVEAIAVHPKEATRILIGYQRGLVVLWDTKNLCADQTYVSSQQLESVCWHPDATHFTTSHNDGSYVDWSALDASQPLDGPHTVYGPFPCKPITKIVRPHSKDGGQFTIFSGGMPRASYGDRHTVTAIEGENRHCTFSLSSRVLDFAVVLDDDTGAASCLVILAEEEVVFIDLESEDWPAFGAPYLTSLHSSAITCAYLAAGVAVDVMEKIKEAGSKQQARLSSRPWPINGGKLAQEEGGKEAKQLKDMLLTGHEDGTVQFWDASSVALQLLYKLSTAQLFVSEDLGGEGAAAEDDDWPPFRKAGLFDPYSDDPRLGVKKMQMCPYTGTVVVAGTAGQVLVMAPASEAKDMVPQGIDINLVAENDNFVWKSHSKLEMRTESVKLEAGMQPTAILQFYPPASCTSLALHTEWGLVACGTAHGFALFDAKQNKNLLAKSTLSPLDLATTADEGPMSRRKSLKKSLRESFRRLRRGRSQRKTGAGRTGGATSPTTTSPPPSTRGGVGGVAEEEGVRPVERAVEARSQTTDHIGSMVRCLHLSKCFIANSQAMSATLWAGTNSGSIFVFTIAIPPSEKRHEVPLTVQLGKEIHLKHGAPVLAVWVLDGAGRPLPPPMAVKKDAAAPPNTNLPHRVLICSEEQFKVFTLPQLKPFCKFKLTAHEGSRARKLDLAEFVSTADASYSETCLALATNQGDFSLFSLPECRRQLYASHLKKEDISGINSVVFTRRGEALFLVSPSELERVSLSSRHITRPKGQVPEVKATPPLVPPKKQEREAKQGGAGDGEGGEATTTTTTASTTTTTTATAATTTTANTTTATAGATALPDSVNTTTLPLKTNEENQSGEKKEKEVEEKEGKASGGATPGGGEGATGGEGGGGGGRKVEEVRENGDSSVLSGDITIDSIRDHMDELKVSEKGVEVLCEDDTTTTTSTTTTTTTISSSSGGGVAVLKSTTVTASSSSSQESQSIRVVETAISTTTTSSSSSSTATAATTAAADSNHSVLNGTETKRRAPLAKAESFFSKEPRVANSE